MRFSMASACAASFVVAATSAFMTPAHSADARGLAAGCSACHGVPFAGMRALAGRPRDEVVRMLQDFRDGKRPGTVMPELARGYTPGEIDALARWLAAQSTP